MNSMLDTQAHSSYYSRMNTLPAAKRVQILSMLCEGMSMRAVARLADVSINTVARQLVLAGMACAKFHDETVRNVKSKRVQADEVWSFVGMKERTAKGKGSDRPDNVGDVWTWTAIDADSKLCISWLLGGRDAGYAFEFMSDVAKRLAHRVQLTTDGHKAYLSAVEDVFGIGIDYAQLVKVYGENTKEENRRYSPAVCLGTERNVIEGNPDPEHISTSYVERSNLSLRMHNRRFTRLTNAFSKRLEMHGHMVALYTVFYNFVRIHKTLRMTPAMAAGVADRLMSMEDVAKMVEEFDATLPRKKPGRKPKAEKAAQESN